MDDSTSKFQWGQIMVFWDVEDWSILEKLNPRLVNEKITSDLYENGYLGPEMFNKLTYVFGHAAMRFVHVPKGNKHARVHFITEQLLLWALYGPSRPAIIDFESFPVPYEVKPVVSDAWADINSEGNTGVFWDVVDFPIPAAECDPGWVSRMIKSGLDRQGCCNGSVSIWLYDVEDEKTKTTKQEVIDGYEAAGVSFNFVPEVAEAHGYARDHKMLVDILRWAVDSPENSNLIVLSKHLDENSLSCIQSLQDAGYNNVVLVKTHLQAQHGFGIGL